MKQYRNDGRPLSEIIRSLEKELVEELSAHPKEFTHDIEHKYFDTVIMHIFLTLLDTDQYLTPYHAAKECDAVLREQDKKNTEHWKMP